MPLQARHESVGIYPDTLVPIVVRKARLLKVAAFGLLIYWWLEVFGLWVKFLQRAVSLEIPQ